MKRHYLNFVAIFFSVVLNSQDFQSNKFGDSLEEDLILNGQDTIKSSKTNIWLNLGFGIEGCGRSDGSPSEAVSLSIQKAFHLVSIKYIHASEFKVLHPIDKLSGYNLMYGLIKKNPKGYCSISTGINYSTLHDIITYGSGWFDYNIMERKKFGVPIDMQLFLTGKWIGIGLNGFVVINSEFTYGGALFCLIFGKVN